MVACEASVKRVLDFAVTDDSLRLGTTAQFAALIVTKG